MAEQFEHDHAPRSLAPELKLAALTFVAFFLWRGIAREIGEEGLWLTVLPVLAAIILCMAVPGPPSERIAPSLRIISRVIASILGLYGIAAVMTYPKNEGPIVSAFLTLDFFLGLAAVVAAAIAFRRPAFVMVTAAVLMGKKAAASQLFNISISHTDYLPLLELGLFFGIGLLLLTPSRFRWHAELSRTVDVERYTVLLFMLGVGFHFSNYFYSGFQKISLDGGPLFWVLHNPTTVLTLNGWVGGFLPTSHWPEVSMMMYRLSSETVVLLNITILIGQLGAVLFILRRRTMIGVTLFYDLTHIVIFLVSGIFFWKWILLNLGLVAAMRVLPSYAETRAFVVPGVIAVLFAPVGFGIVWLGWYDSPALVTSSFHAVTKDGREVDVPSNFFGSVSISQAQHRLGRPEAGHYPTVTWGTTQEVEIFNQAMNDCTFANDAAWKFRRSEERIGYVLKSIHAYATEQETRKGRYRYDAYPHHIWSNLFIYDDFAALKMADIDHYIYRTVSGCVSAGPTEPHFAIDRVHELRFRPDGTLMGDETNE